MAQPPRRPQIGEEVPPDLLEIGAEVPESLLEPEGGMPPPPSWLDVYRQANPGIDLAGGVVKGATGTAINLGELALRVPVLGRALQSLNQALFGLSPEQQQASFGQARAAVAPSNTMEQVGRFAEQGAEFLLPAGKATQAVGAVTRGAPRVARGLARVGTEGAVAGGVTKAQGGNPTAGAVMGAVGGGVAPAVDAGVQAGGRWLGRQALPLVQSGLKPTVAATKKVAGVSATGIDAQAKALAQFILDNRLTSPAKAEALIKDAEREIQDLVKNSTATTDAPDRAMRYLQALRRSANKQALPEDDVRRILGKARELIRNDYGHDVTSTVMAPSKILGPNGQPLQVPKQVTTRELRPDMAPAEALERARATSLWQTRNQWGEQKGAVVEAKKATDRASRDAVKLAVPETKPLFHREMMGIRSKQALDRQAFRESNRDPVSLPAQTLAAGHRSMLALASNWLRNNPVRAGIYAQDLSRAIKRQDVDAVGAILMRLGVPIASLSTQP